MSCACWCGLVPATALAVLLSLRRTIQEHEQLHLQQQVLQLRELQPSVADGLLDEERLRWQAFIGSLQPPVAAEAPRGRGVVIIGGLGLKHGADYSVEALMAIAALRLVGCRLPVELWHNGDQRLLELHALQQLNVSLRDLLPAAAGLQSYQLITFAVTHSEFEELLFLDSDNVPVADPTQLFEAPAYVTNGAVFWPDWPLLSPSNSFWRLIGREAVRMPCIETAQMLLHRGKHWRALALAHYFNERGPLGYYLMSYGDTGMFAFAFFALNASFQMVPTPLGLAGYTRDGVFCGHTMLQFHPDTPEKVMFAHKAHMKWSMTLPSREAAWDSMKHGRVVDAHIEDPHGWYADRLSDHNKYIHPPTCSCNDGKKNYYCYDFADYRDMPRQPIPASMAALDRDLLRVKAQLLGPDLQLRRDFVLAWAQWLEKQLS